MGIVLCKTKRSETPYLIKKTGVRIYCVEELCYYIYNNIYLIDDEFFDDSMIGYLRDDLKLSEIAQGMENLRKKNGTASDLVSYLMKNVDFYDMSKIAALVEIVKNMSKKTETQRYMCRAGNFLRNNCIRLAIDDYKNAILSTEDDKVKAVAYYNIGVAHAKRFDYKKAFSYFHEAYEIEKSSRMLEAMYKASLMHKLAHNEELMKVPEDSERLILNNIEKRMNEMSLSDELQDELLMIDERKDTEIRRLITDLKKKYQYML